MSPPELPAASATRIPYGADPNQFGELRVPSTPGPFPVLMHIHGGFWRAEYDLALANPVCAAFDSRGVATWNLEYRRIGNPGGGWPGTFQDIRTGYRFLSQIASKYKLDSSRLLVMGHSAGGELALCLAAHEPTLKRVISLSGVVDMEQAWELHLGNNAVGEFLGGTPKEVSEHYREADPMQLSIKATQWLIHGASDDVVPSSLSRNYAEQKRNRGEDVHYLEIASAGHSDLIDPHSAAWPKIESTVMHLLS
jgi:acetyl esterase/lipase